MKFDVLACIEFRIINTFGADSIMYCMASCVHVKYNWRFEDKIFWIKRLNSELHHHFALLPAHKNKICA